MFEYSPKTAVSINLGKLTELAGIFNWIALKNNVSFYKHFAKRFLHEKKCKFVQLRRTWSIVSAKQMMVINTHDAILHRGEN